MIMNEIIVMLPFDNFMRGEFAFLVVGGMKNK